MGSKIFYVIGKGRDQQEAFQNIVYSTNELYPEEYSGTIKEKETYIMIPCPKNVNAYVFAEDLIRRRDYRVDDKWGPAGCIDLGENEEGRRNYLFFGWASC